jgi:hypothetical protein
MKTPRTMSSSVLRAQSSASRFNRNVLLAIGQPVLRTTAFHLPIEGLMTVAREKTLPETRAGTPSDNDLRLYLHLYLRTLARSRIDA